LKIYHVKHDPAYASIEVTQAEGATDISDLRGGEINDFAAPMCRLVDPSAKVGHFYGLNDTALVFNKASELEMGSFIEYAGQIHPLQVKGVGQLGLLNVTEVGNPINKSESEIVDGNWKATLSQHKLVFHQQRVFFSMSSLFKIPELDYRPILTFSDGSTDEFIQEEDFYKFYHENNMTGLIFEEIWSSS